MDREALFEHYSRMPEELFTYFATHEVAGLPPEAVEILRQVMTARGTVPDPDAVIDIQCRHRFPEFDRSVAMIPRSASSRARTRPRRFGNTCGSTVESWPTS